MGRIDLITECNAERDRSDRLDRRFRNRGALLRQFLSLSILVFTSHFVFGQSAIEELKKIEQQITAILPRVLPTVVCIESGNGSGSGVIVSQDGLVLTAAHVIDKGTELAVVYPDGRRFRAKALGTFGPADAGMVQILEGAPHRFAQVALGDQLKLNEVVLSLGHPSGFDLQRGTPLRIGHLMEIGENFLSLDNALIGGDSGGPSFNLAGQVIGIHSHISSDQIYTNKDGSIRAFRENWEPMRSGEKHKIHYSKSIGGQSDPGKNTSEANRPKADKPKADSPEANRAPAAETTPRPTSRLQELQKAANDNAGRLKLSRDELQSLRASMAKKMESLNPSGGKRMVDQWSSVWQEAFRPKSTTWRESIHRVYVADRARALATAISEDGILITKASEIQGKSFEIEIATDQRIPGQIIHLDNTLDLALVQIRGSQLNPANWNQKDPNPGMGVLCAAVNLNQELAGFGTISVAARPLDGKSGAFLGAQVEATDGGVQVLSIKPGSPAEQGGMKLNDVLTAVENEPLATPNQLTDFVQAHVEGELLRFDVKRSDVYLSLTVKLGDGAKLAPMPGSREQATDAMSTMMSKRRWSFASGIQHDCAILPQDCGGPLIDLEGRLLGINIARAGRIQSYAIPTARVQHFVTSYQAGDQP
ncbi:MAG: trypsin-like peptidase domain-containing protein [Pirellula sp.]